MNFEERYFQECENSVERGESPMLALVPRSVAILLALLAFIAQKPLQFIPQLFPWQIETKPLLLLFAVPILVYLFVASALYAGLPFLYRTRQANLLSTEGGMIGVVFSFIWVALASYFSLQFFFIMIRDDLWPSHFATPWLGLLLLLWAVMVVSRAVLQAIRFRLGVLRVMGDR